MEERLVKLQAKITADGNLAEKLFSLENPEEVQSFLKEQGLEFSLEEIGTIRDAINKSVKKAASGELSDEDLEDVAGGSIGQVIDGIIDNIGNFIKIGGRRW